MSLGIDLRFKYKLVTGLEFELLKLFDDTRCVRVKTDRRQTEYFLLQKADVRRKFGTTWKFNLYAGAEHFLGGLSGQVVYQFVRHDTTSFHPKQNCFSQDIMNTSERLEDFHTHNISFKLDYDGFKCWPKKYIKPQISAFYKLPFAGRRAITPSTWGLQVSLNF